MEDINSCLVMVYYINFTVLAVTLYAKILTKYPLQSLLYSGFRIRRIHRPNTRCKTLSGGEKFNASLCLALGMADVIQAYEGGISIETMFIDEGFGSLDEESLTKAVDALIDLQKSGRFIGVISHVQELKNAMPAVLEVTKQKDGCSQTRFVVK